MDKQNKKSGSDDRTPAESCIVCNKQLKEVGGKRIIAQISRGIVISDKYQEGNGGKYPRQYYKLTENPDKYLTIWGKELQKDGIIERAEREYAEGKQSWFCQVCGNRTCEECGAPIQFLVGSDILDDDGNSSHIPILPVSQGCINPKCKRYKVQI